MTPTLSQIGAVIAMVAVNVAIFVWFQRSEAAASTRRMIGMMTRVGLTPGAHMLGDWRTEAVVKEARHRCGRCPREALCDRWLAGEEAGDNAFCPNAGTFRALQPASR